MNKKMQRYIRFTIVATCLHYMSVMLIGFFTDSPQPIVLTMIDSVATAIMLITGYFTLNVTIAFIKNGLAGIKDYWMSLITPDEEIN